METHDTEKHMCQQISLWVGIWNGWCLPESLLFPRRRMGLLGRVAGAGSFHLFHESEEPKKSRKPSLMGPSQGHQVPTQKWPAVGVLSSQTLSCPPHRPSSGLATPHLLSNSITCWLFRRIYYCIFPIYFFYVLWPIPSMKTKGKLACSFCLTCSRWTTRFRESIINTYWLAAVSHELSHEKPGCFWDQPHLPCLLSLK